MYRAVHEIQRTGVQAVGALDVAPDAGLIMSWMGEIIGLTGLAAAVVASRKIRTPGPGLGDARNRLFWLATILLS
jgi:hypothetical protein